jgi:hypothetical protein
VLNEDWPQWWCLWCLFIVHVQSELNTVIGTQRPSPFPTHGAAFQTVHIFCNIRSNLLSNTYYVARSCSIRAAELEMGHSDKPAWNVLGPRAHHSDPRGCDRERGPDHPQPPERCVLPRHDEFLLGDGRWGMARHLTQHSIEGKPMVCARLYGEVDNSFDRRALPLTKRNGRQWFLVASRLILSLLLKFSLSLQSMGSFGVCGAMLGSPQCAVLAADVGGCQGPRRISG